MPKLFNALIKEWLDRVKQKQSAPWHPPSKGLTLKFRDSISSNLEIPGAFLYNLAMSDFHPENILIYRTDDSKIRGGVLIVADQLCLVKKRNRLYKDSIMI